MLFEYSPAFLGNARTLRQGRARIRVVIGRSASLCGQQDPEWALSWEHSALRSALHDGAIAHVTALEIAGQLRPSSCPAGQGTAGQLSGQLA